MNIGGTIFNREPLKTLSKGMLQKSINLLGDCDRRGQLEVAKTPGHGGHALHVGGGEGT